MEPDSGREKVRVHLSQRDSCPQWHEVGACLAGKSGAEPGPALWSLAEQGPLRPQLVSHPRVVHPAPKQELQQPGSGTLLLAPLLEGPEADSSQASVLWGTEVPGWTLPAPHAACHSLAAGGSRLGSEHRSQGSSEAWKDTQPLSPPHRG